MWDSIKDFERHEKLNREMRTAGESRTVVFMDDGKLVDAATIENAYQQKGLTGIKPKRCMVFVVKDNDQKKEFWLNETCYSSLRELRAIREQNNGSLAGAAVKITRTAVNDPKVSNWKFEEAEALQ